MHDSFYEHISELHEKYFGSKSANDEQTKTKDNARVLPVGILFSLATSLFQDAAIKEAVQQALNTVAATAQQFVADDLARVAKIEKRLDTLEHAIKLMVASRVATGQMEDPFKV